MIVLLLNRNDSSYSNSSEEVTFLNKTYSNEVWLEMKSVIDCFCANGKWILNNSSDDNYHYYNMLYTTPCSMVSHYIDGTCSTKNRPNIWNYRWEPNCELLFKRNFQRWSQPNMCSLLDNINILIVGDSIYECYL